MLDYIFRSLLVLLCFLGKTSGACDPGFIIPKGFTTVQLDIGKIQVVDREILTGTSGTTGHLQPLGDFKLGVEKLSKDLQAVLGASSENIRVVFYPFSGSDSFTPLLLFPHASVFVAVDQHPFLKNWNGHTSLVINPAQPVVGAWRGEDHIRADGMVGARILESLYAAVPNIRVHNIVVFSPHQHLDYSNSAIIEFDSGPGTPRRYWVQISDYVSGRELLESYWWGDQVMALGINAVTVKSTWSLWHQLYPNPREPKLRPFRDSMLSHLVSSEGVLVEGMLEKGTVPAGEVSGVLSKFRLRPYVNGITWMFASEYFGYQDHVLASRFFRRSPLWPVLIRKR